MASLRERGLAEAFPDMLWNETFNHNICKRLELMLLFEKEVAFVRQLLFVFLVASVLKLNLFEFIFRAQRFERQHLQRFLFFHRAREAGAREH